MPEPLLCIDNLTIESMTSQRVLVQNFSLQLHAHQNLALVGENGSGKTTILKAIAGFLPDNCRIVSGSIFLKGQNILRMKQNQFNRMRGRVFSMVLQNAMSALTPSMRIGEQIIEALKKHSHLSKEQIHHTAIQLLRNVNIDQAEECLSLYPFQLSGGMQQRVIIAIALANSPEFLLADEPTTALDSVSQAQIIHIFQKIRLDRLTTVLLVTHNLSLVADLCDHIIVIKNGEIVETGTVTEVFESPEHPYTKSLLQAVTKIPVYPSTSSILKRKLLIG